MKKKIINSKENRVYPGPKSVKGSTERVETLYHPIMSNRIEEPPETVFVFFPKRVSNRLVVNKKTESNIDVELQLECYVRISSLPKNLETQVHKCIKKISLDRLHEDTLAEIKS